MSAMIYISQVGRLEKDLTALEKRIALERRKAAQAQQAASRRRQQLAASRNSSQRRAWERDAARLEDRSLKHEARVASLREQLANRGEQLRRAKELRRRAEQLSLDPRPPAGHYAFDVCLSFAGEQRGYVEQVHRALVPRGYEVFYDADRTVEIWGQDQVEYFDYVFRRASRFCVMFVSAEYEKKKWTRYERRCALARALEEDGYVLPVRFDDTELPGLSPNTGYLDLGDYRPEELAELIASKLGRPRADRGAGAGLS